MTTDHEAKAREIVGSLDGYYPENEDAPLVSAIASALREAEAGERGACAKIAAQMPFTMTMYGEMYMGGATTASNEIAASIRSRSKTDE